MQPIRAGYRDFGKAESRYSELSDSINRSLTANRIESLAAEKNREAIQSGNQGYSKRADGLYKMAHRLENCRGKYRIISCNSCGQRYVTPSRCEVRICEYCARKYAMRFRSKLQAFIKELPRKNGRKLMFLTLTKRTDQNRKLTPADIKKLFKDARKLINKLFPKKNDCGAFAILEIGKHSNPHIHLLVYGPFIPQANISKLWLKITGDSKIVDIRRVKGHKHAVNYLTKYLFKPLSSDMPGDKAQFLDLITGIRRIHTYGVFYGTFTLKKDSFPCPFCKGSLRYLMLDAGSVFPENYLTFEEAIQAAKEMAN